MLLLALQRYVATIGDTIVNTFTTRSIRFCACTMGLKGEKVSFFFIRAAKWIWVLTLCVVEVGPLWQKKLLVTLGVKFEKKIWHKRKHIPNYSSQKLTAFQTKIYLSGIKIKKNFLWAICVPNSRKIWLKIELNSVSKGSKMDRNL